MQAAAYIFAFTTVYGLMLVLIVLLARVSLGYSSTNLVVTGTIIAVLGTFAGFDMTTFDPPAGINFPVKVGYGFMAFSSVLGGALAGIGLAEVRRRITSEDVK